MSTQGNGLGFNSFSRVTRPGDSNGRFERDQETLGMRMDTKKSVTITRVFKNQHFK
jgi:hypothetical protein